ncbi:MAG: NTP transferase domain-containing protein [Ignavibacteria bacterium]|nr:NTP transferase domain-containing protein [Ignavibacteria bacterium]MBK7158118.1 NTP transferase domain-containing protein [Ignavibacteria bacterium]MBK7253701.1 NTP transferase domain-containing protein [Ignavibacteria bacterium]MBK9404176.1 NTP transferase domain-containing protein [Ignavibacteria bacterium]
MKVVILAGGLGSRLKPFTEVIPKPLLPIGEKSVLEIQIERLKKHGFDEIFLATNYKSQYIEGFFGDGSRYGVKLMISKEEKPLGTAGPLLLLKEHLTEPFIVMNGDILSLIDFSKLYDFALSQDSLLTISIKKEITPFAFGNIYFEGDRVTGIQEKPNIVMYILSGIYVMKPEIFKFFPKDEYFGMDNLILKMLEEDKVVSKYDLKEYWLDIGRLNDYEKAQEVYNEHFSESK